LKSNDLLLSEEETKRSIEWTKQLELEL
jgi:hypothetical protein